MDDFVAYSIARTIPMILGAVEIDWAISNYKSEKYFLFGFWLMAALSNLIVIARVIMKG